MMKHGAMILAWIDSIAKVSKKKEKSDLLKKASDYPEALEVLKLAYSPEYNFGVRLLESLPEKAPKEGAADISSILEWLRVQGTGQPGSIRGNELKAHVDDLLDGTLDAQSRTLAIRILRRDLRAGINVASINAEFPGLIPEVPYMRCSLPDKKFKDWEWDKGVYVQIKADGMFQRAKVTPGGVSFMSRSGEIMPEGALAALETEIAELFSPDTMLDGELLVLNTAGDILPRAEGNGILNSIRQKGVADHTVIYVIWDAHHEGDNRPYDERFTDVLSSARLGGLVRPIETRKVNTFEAAIKWTTEVMKAGGEGTVAKRASGLWKDGTSKDQIKLKVEFEVDVKVTGFVPGKAGTKREKTFGALMYESVDGLVSGSVSGFKDALLKEISENRDSWLDAIITVRANDLTQNEKDLNKWALSHPRFIERRHDKVVADDLQKIKDSLEAAKEMR